MLLIASSNCIIKKHGGIAWHDIYSFINNLQFIFSSINIINFGNVKEDFIICDTLYIHISRSIFLFYSALEHKVFPIKFCKQYISVIFLPPFGNKLLSIAKLVWCSLPTFLIVHFKLYHRTNLTRCKLNDVVAKLQFIYS